MEARVSTNGKQHILLHELDPEGSYQLIVSKNNRILLSKLMRLGENRFGAKDCQSLSIYRPRIDIFQVRRVARDFSLLLLRRLWRRPYRNQFLSMVPIQPQ